MNKYQITEKESTPEGCTFCGNEEYKIGLCRPAFLTHEWLENAFSCLDGSQAYDLVENPEYSDYYFSPREKKTKAQAVAELYKMLNDLERKEFLVEIMEGK